MAAAPKIGLAGVAWLHSSPAARADGAATTLPLAGVNLAGAEFGRTLLGRRGHDYAYPREETIQLYADQGYPSLRIPFLWERLQPYVDGPFDDQEWKWLNATIERIVSRNMQVVLDVHNYARRGVVDDKFETKHRIGSEKVPTSSFVEFWKELASRTMAEPKVIYGIMNEPIDHDPMQWLDITNQTIAGIREVGAENLLLLPGISWTGAHSWYRVLNTVLEAVEDPKANFAIEVHQYLDGNSSGKDGEVEHTTLGSQRIEAFQEWARARSFKAYLGEFGAGNNPIAGAALDDMAREMAASPDVWLGWAGWAGGAMWYRQYPLLLDPDENGVWPVTSQKLSAQARGDASVLSTNGGLAPDDAVLDIDFARGQWIGADAMDQVITYAREGRGRSLWKSGIVTEFRADEPRVTDLGLRLEGASRWRMGPEALLSAVLVTGRGFSNRPSPVGGQDVTSIRQGEQSIQLWPTDGLPESEFATLSVFAYADPRLQLELDAYVGQERVVFDLGSGVAHAVSGGVFASLTASGDWRHASLCWRPQDGDDIFFSAKRVDGKPHYDVGLPPDVELWHAALEPGCAATLFESQDRAADIATISGRFAEAMRGGAFTVMIETRNVTVGPDERPLLSVGDKLLLGRTADGGVRTELGGGLATGRRDLRYWQHRQRSAISVSNLDVGVATTGLSAVSTSLTEATNMLATLRLGAVARGDNEIALNGCVTRIVAYNRAMDLEQLSALVS